jgi:hypothetical protein
MCKDAAWSPDGKWIYVTSDFSGTSQLWRQEFPDGIPEQLTHGVTVAEGIAVAPDGKSIITSIGMDQGSVWVKAGGNDRQVSPEGDAILPFFGAGYPGSMFSPDGKKLFYLVHRGPSLVFGGGELWIADLEKNVPEVFLPGMHVGSFDVSHDGLQIVFSTVDEKRIPRIWLAATDRRFEPKQLPPGRAMGPVFSSASTIVYRGAEGPDDFHFELDLASGAIRKLIAEKTTTAPIVSPDGAWIIAEVASPDPRLHSRMVAYPRAGGESRALCDRCSVKWSRDGRSMFLYFGIQEFRSEAGNYIIPLQPGRQLPNLPKEGIRSAADLKQLRAVPASKGPFTLFPGPTADIYAYSKRSVQRNLYRLWLP